MHGAQEDVEEDEEGHVRERNGKGKRKGNRKGKMTKDLNMPTCIAL